MKLADTLRRRGVLLAAVAGIAVFSAQFSLVHAAATKYSPKDVMIKANKAPKKGDDSLFQTVIGGKGTSEDKTKLAELYAALAQDDAPKGDPKDWKTRTEAMAAASKAIAEGDANAVATLKTAADCKGCHQQHRPPKQ